MGARPRVCFYPRHTPASRSHMTVARIPQVSLMMIMRRTATTTMAQNVPRNGLASKRLPRQPVPAGLPVRSRRPHRAVHLDPASRRGSKGRDCLVFFFFVIHSPLLVIRCLCLSHSLGPSYVIAPCTIKSRISINTFSTSSLSCEATNGQ